MSALTAKKKEAFARAVAAGASFVNAYKETRDCSRMKPSTIRANAKKLAREPAVAARIEELRESNGGEFPRGAAREGRESSGESSQTPRGFFRVRNRLSNQAKRGGQGGGRPHRPGTSHRHLDSLGGVVREMSAIYREARTQQMKADLACKLVYVLREIRAALEAQALERLEQRLESIEGGRHGDASQHRATASLH